MYMSGFQMVSSFKIVPVRYAEELLTSTLSKTLILQYEILENLVTHVVTIIGIYH